MTSKATTMTFSMESATLVCPDGREYQITEMTIEHRNTVSAIDLATGKPTTIRRTIGRVVCK